MNRIKRLFWKFVLYIDNGCPCMMCSYVRDRELWRKYDE